MTDDHDRALVRQGPTTLGPVSRLAERTLSERAERVEPALVAAGRTLIVGPGGWATIREAVAEAQDGDTVLVRPGTYREPLVIERAITLRGDGSREDVVVVGSDVECLRLIQSTATVCNMTFLGGGGGYPADPTDRLGLASISIAGGAPGLFGVTLADGHGIVVDHAGAPRIAGCALRGARIVIRGGSCGLIEDNVISADVFWAVMIADEGSAPTIRGNSIQSTGFEYPSGAITLENGASPIVEDNEIVGDIEVRCQGTAPLIRGNTVKGGAIGIHHGTTPTIGANASVVRTERWWPGGVLYSGDTEYIQPFVLRTSVSVAETPIPTLHNCIHDRHGCPDAGTMWDDLDIDTELFWTVAEVHAAAIRAGVRLRPGHLITEATAALVHRQLARTPARPMADIILEGPQAADGLDTGWPWTGHELLDALRVAYAEVD